MIFTVVRKHSVNIAQWDRQPLKLCWLIGWFKPSCFYTCRVQAMFQTVTGDKMTKLENLKKRSTNWRQKIQIWRYSQTCEHTGLYRLLPCTVLSKLQHLLFQFFLSVYTCVHVTDGYLLIRDHGLCKRLFGLVIWQTHIELCNIDVFVKQFLV